MLNNNFKHKFNETVKIFTIMQVRQRECRKYRRLDEQTKINSNSLQLQSNRQTVKGTIYSQTK